MTHVTKGPHWPYYGPMTGLAQRLSPPGSVPYPGNHLGLRWRPLISRDAPAVYDLVRAVESADDAIHRTGAEGIADMVEGRGGEDWVDAIVGLDRNGSISAVGCVRVVRGVSDSAIAIVFAYVHPHWRGRGLGRALLHWQDGRAREMLVETYGPDNTIPASIANFVDAHMTDRRRLYIAAGFYAKRTLQVMYRDLEGSESAPRVRGGYTVVPWDRALRDKARELHMEVSRDLFWSWNRARWWDDAVASMERRWSFLALDPGGAVVGYIVTERPAQRWVSTGRPEAGVSLVGVLPQHRGRSLCSALIGHSVAAASASGMPRIGIEVDTRNPSNAHAIYEHLGFVDDAAEVFYVIDQ